MTGEPLSPIIKKGDPIRPFPSPHFSSPPSPVHSEGGLGLNSYFAPSQPQISPSPSGILINKPSTTTPSTPLLSVDTTSFDSPLDSSSSFSAATASPNTTLGFDTGVAGDYQPVGAALARVGSPDGTASETDASSAAGSTSTAPSSQLGSPDVKPRPRSPTESMATLSLQNLPEGLSASHQHLVSPTLQSSATVRLSRSPSPHCHFAPLPKVEPQERPGTRRNSIAQGNVPRKPAADGTEFAVDMDDSPFPASTLTSSLLNIDDPASAAAPVRFRRSSGSISGRSASPSPQRRPSSAQSSSRSHSPPMISRHASQDALHLHRIPVRPIPGSSSHERDRSNERIERDGSPTFTIGPGPSGSGSRVQSRDRDELVTALRNLTIPPSSPASPDGAEPPQQRRPMSFVEPDRGIVGRCKPVPSIRIRSREVVDGVERDVIEVGVLSESDEELDQVEEEDEEAEESDEHEESGEEEEDEGEPKTQEDLDEEQNDEEEEEEAPNSKTAMGAGVEVVHWHKEEPETLVSPTTIPASS